VDTAPPHITQTYTYTYMYMYVGYYSKYYTTCTVYVVSTGEIGHVGNYVHATYMYNVKGSLHTCLECTSCSDWE